MSELVVLYGINWAGAGGVTQSVMPDKETCIMALDHSKINISGKLATGQDSDVVIIFCRPKGDNNGKK